mmetsp:Transcript_41331/g.133209  ORF Transcript_41331/g.133209 Transcript_41331/m.133209 type:complete len:204 (-) Transcript_41331:677-1288(-)
MGCLGRPRQPKQHWQMGARRPVERFFEAFQSKLLMHTPSARAVPHLLHRTGVRADRLVVWVCCLRDVYAQLGGSSARRAFILGVCVALPNLPSDHASLRCQPRDDFRSRHLQQLFREVIGPVFAFRSGFRELSEVQRGRFCQRSLHGASSIGVLAGLKRKTVSGKGRGGVFMVCVVVIALCVRSQAHTNIVIGTVAFGDRMLD